MAIHSLHVILTSWMSLFAAVDVPSQEQVRQAYSATSSSIHTLEADTRTRWEVLRPNLPQSFSGTELTLWKKGDLRAIRITNLDLQEQPDSTNWIGYNGKTYSSWSSKLQADDTPVEQLNLPSGKTTAVQIGQLYEEPVLDLLLGAWVSPGNLTLASLLAGEIVSISWDEVGDQRCVKIEFAPHQRSRHRPEQLAVKTTAWFDPAVGYLPRQIISLDYVRGDAEPPFEWGTRTDTFQKLRGEDGVDYVVPHTGVRWNSLQRMSLEVTRARINCPIANTLFSPQFPDMTLVYEELPNQPPRKRIVGDAARRQRLEKLRDATTVEKENAKSLAAQTIPAIAPPNASPQASAEAIPWLTYGFLTCALLAFVIAGWSLRNRQPS